MTSARAHAVRKQRTRPSICFAVVSAVAERMGVPEQDVATPLYDAVDTDALERLLSRDAAGRHPTEVSFEYAGYRVTARSDGTVAVE